MANKTTPPSLQDILRKRQQSDFVGRVQQVADFRANLRYDVTDERRKFIFSISGQGGVGKTWLARRLRKIAEEFGAATALTDEAETDVPSAMGRIADQLEEQGHPLKAFSERYKVYRQRKQELEADPDAPQGLTAFVTRTVVDVGFDLLEHTPAGVVTKHLPREMLATQASEWAEFVRRKLANKDETRLVLEPIPVLTPLWLAGLAEVAQEHPLALFLDTYERTCPLLDPWLREVLEGRHGVVPASIVWTISGRDALDENDWAPYRGLVAAAALEPFTEEEAREYLGSKGITDPKIVEVILRLSGRLPLLVATLATQSPSDAEHIEDPADTAVERFLKWVDDPAQRRAALHAALPRRLNQDILACLVDSAQVEALFAWLQTMPFLQKRGDYWEYHEVVRSAMLRYLRTQSPKTWADLHRRLAEHYEAARDGLGLDPEQGRKDSAWQELALEALYHRLCQAPKANLSMALNGFLIMVKSQRAFACRWADTVSVAGETAAAVDVAAWGSRLATGLRLLGDSMTACDEGQCDASITTFTLLLELPSLETRTKPTALELRGIAHRLAGHNGQAIADLSEAIQLSNEILEKPHEPSCPFCTSCFANRGAAYIQIGEFAEALADLNRTIELNPDCGLALQLRGLSLVRTGEYTKALADFDRVIDQTPDYAEYFVNRAEAHLGTGDIARALTDFNRAIELNPDYAVAIAKRGQIYRQMGEFDQALPDFDRAIALEPDNASMLANRAETYRMMGKIEEALSDFNRTIELKPDNASMLAKRGETYRQMGEYAKALPDFDRVLELDPQDSHWAHEQRGLALRGIGRLEEAIDAFMQAEQIDPSCASCLASRGDTYRQMDEFAKALPDFNRAIELETDNASMFAGRGETYRQMGEFAKALADFDRAIALEPDNASMLARRAKIYGQMGEYAQALTDFDHAIELQPDYAWAIALRGETYRQMDEFAKALSDFDRVLELDPQNAHWVHEQRGLALRDLSRFQEAIDAFMQAEQIDPCCAPCLADRGETYRLMDEFAQALPDFDRAIELQPDYAWAIACRGQTYRQMGKFDQALPDFDRAIELEPDNASMLAGRGETYRLMGEYAKALPDFDRALELEPDNAGTLARRGDIYESLKRYDEAIADYACAIQLEPDDPYHYNNLAGVYLSVGKLEEAADEYGKRIELSPDNALHANVTLGIIRWHGDQLDDARGHFETALGVCENACAAQVQTPAGLLENRAIALLCLGNQPEAFTTLREALAAAQPGDQLDPDDERYALLASAPHLPDGLEQFRGMIRAEVQRSAQSDPAQ